MVPRVQPNKGAALLAAALKERGLGVNAAGALMQAPKGAVSRLLRQTRRPELKLAVAIWREFGVPVEAWLQPTPPASTEEAAA